MAPRHRRAEIDCRSSVAGASYRGSCALTAAIATQLLGCTVPPKRDVPSTQPATAARPIEIRLAARPPAADLRLGSARSLQCIVTGMGRLPETGHPSERQRAARQAAIVDALHRAAIALGVLDTGDAAHSVAFSDRLALHHIPARREVTLRYHDRGRVHQLRVVDRRLAHPSVRATLIETFLAEVAQDVRLVGTRHDSDTRTWFARMACYEPAVDGDTPSGPRTNHQLTQGSPVR